MYIFLKTYNPEYVLEWAERVVAIAIARAIVVTITRVIVAVIVIASAIDTRFVRIAMGFDLPPI